ncbi:MAG: hypothetical protein ACREN8_01970 [Candidatus Dormibacteraceae bacterium]
MDDDEGKRRLRIVRRGTGSVVTWRRAQMVLPSAQNMEVAGLARVAFTSEDRVRDVIHNFNADGEAEPREGEPEVMICVDEFGPLNLQPRPGRAWAEANNVEIAYPPTNNSWLNRIEAQFTALRYFALNGTDHQTHQQQGSMIRRYITWRNRHAEDLQLRRIVDRANVA